MFSVLNSNKKVGPSLWNALPLNNNMCKSVYIFKRQLRVEIFKGYI